MDYLLRSTALLQKSQNPRDQKGLLSLFDFASLV